MLRKYLEKYKKEHKLTWEDVAKEIDITRQTLDKVMKYKSPKTEARTVMKIKIFTNLECWDYLNGLDTLKKIYFKNK